MVNRDFDPVSTPSAHVLVIATFTGSVEQCIKLPMSFANFVYGEDIIYGSNIVTHQGCDVEMKFKVKRIFIDWANDITGDPLYNLPFENDMGNARLIILINSTTHVISLCLYLYDCVPSILTDDNLLPLATTEFYNRISNFILTLNQFARHIPTSISSIGVKDYRFDNWEKIQRECKNINQLTFQIPEVREKVRERFAIFCLLKCNEKILKFKDMLSELLSTKRDLSRAYISHGHDEPPEYVRLYGIFTLSEFLSPYGIPPKIIQFNHYIENNLSM
jgi:hypothetical protein